VSARHQVKRLDRISQELALSKLGPAEETSFLRSVRIFSDPQFHRRSNARVKSGPDVFADALVLLRRRPKGRGSLISHTSHI
jgi:hypothetical protein